MENLDVLPHLFRKEFRKIVAVLCKLYGFEYIETAEDIAGETFLVAAETWPYKGVPPNPAAWLYSVAKNKAKNQLTRRQVFSEKIAPQVIEHTPLSEPETEWAEKTIADSQLQMMFAVCNPLISEEAQVCLALRILCGFGIDEIANAFLSNKETINKRLYRAKEKLRQEKVELELPLENEIDKRLDNVLLCLYLLYSEGYYSESDDNVLREDLCFEAMHLTQMLITNQQTNTRAANALYALMCFHSSRFAARKNSNNELILYDDQDENLWNKEMIATGVHHLKLASSGKALSKYHIEASIAYWHTIKEDTPEKWDNILLLYNHLLQLAYTPIAALNRTYAFAKVHGAKRGVTEALKLKLDDNPYYFTMLGELYKQFDRDNARKSFLSAMALAKTEADKELLIKQLRDLE